MCSSITSFLQITGTNNQQACSRSDLRTTVRPKYVIEFKSASRSFPKFRTLHNFVLAYENNYLIIKPLKHWKIIYILFAILMHILRSIEAFLQSLGKPLSSTNLKPRWWEGEVVFRSILYNVNFHYHPFYIWTPLNSHPFLLHVSWWITVFPPSFVCDQTWL